MIMSNWAKGEMYAFAVLLGEALAVVYVIGSLVIDTLR